MRSIKVAMVGLPGMLHEILLKVFSNASDIEIVGQFHNFSDLQNAKPLPIVDVVVLNDQDAQLDALSLEFLEHQPRSAVVQISAHGRNNYLVQLLPKRKSLGEVSPRELLTAIRRAIGNRTWSFSQ